MNLAKQLALGFKLRIANMYTETYWPSCRIGYPEPHHANPKDNAFAKGWLHANRLITSNRRG